MTSFADHLFTIFRVLHIIAGFSALLIFWLPIVTRKGGKTHVRAGWIYVGAMAIVAVTAWYMGIWRIVWDVSRTEESVAFAWFLIFIAMLSTATAWYGIRVLRFKQRNSSHGVLLDLFIPLALVLMGIGISFYGWRIHYPLIQWFPLVGIVLGTQQLFYWLKPPKTKMHWWFQHMGGMMGCCIATITAFTVFGAPRLLQLDTVYPLIWFIPTIVLTPVIIGFSAYYRKKFKAKAM